MHYCNSQCRNRLVTKEDTNYILHAEISTEINTPN